METLLYGKHEVGIEAGELVSYRFEKTEIIHQKGSPGWRNSDTEMFPVIGPTAEAAYRVQVPKGNAIQDQHGLLRELEYSLISKDDTSAVFRKEYRAGELVKNSKFPEKSSMQWLIWPYTFTFEKCFELNSDGLTISFKVEGDKDMPYMIGYHPAFRLTGAAPVLKANDQLISLDEVMQAGSRALEVPEASEFLLKDEKEVRIKTEGFGTFMLWTEVPNMICIEPVSYYPYAKTQGQLHDGFQYLEGKAETFEVIIKPS